MKKKPLVLKFENNITHFNTVPVHSLSSVYLSWEVFVNDEWVTFDKLSENWINKNKDLFVNVKKMFDYGCEETSSIS